MPEHGTEAKPHGNLPAPKPKARKKRKGKDKR